MVACPVRVERLLLETGHWCRTCQLPSGLRQHVTVAAPGGPLVMQTAVKCCDCGGRDLALDPARVGRASNLG